MKDQIVLETRMLSRHDIRASRKTKQPEFHQSWDIFNALANWAVDEAGGSSKVFGVKPATADYTPTDLGVETGKAVKSSIANAPEIQALLERILPGYREMVKTGSANTLALLRGEIPKDVQAAIQRSSAFKALQGGYAGSGMGRALTARDLGRTSLDLTQQGENSAQRWAGLTQASAAPWMITGAQQADTTTRNNLYSQITQQQKYNVAAAPDPGAAGIFNLQAAMGAMAASWGMSSALGGQKSSNTAGAAQGYNFGGNYSGMQGGASNLGNTWGSYNAGWGG